MRLSCPEADVDFPGICAEIVNRESERFTEAIFESESSAYNYPVDSFLTIGAPI